MQWSRQTKPLQMWAHDPPLGRIWPPEAPAPTGEPPGDDFFALLTQYEKTLLRMAVAMVGPDDADDAMQEAVTRAWQAWATLREPESAGAWLLRIMGNVCRRWRNRRFGVSQRPSTSFDLLADEQNAMSELECGTALARLEAHPGDSDHARALDVRRAVNSLEDGLRLIVVLRFYAGLDSTAIGEALSMPSATVRTRLRRALGILRERLGIPLEETASQPQQPQQLSDKPPISQQTPRPEGRS